MASAAAARAALRSSTLRIASTRANAAATAAARPSLRLPRRQIPASAPRFARSPMISFCVESLLPMHSATASAVMNSLLSVSRRDYSWLSKAGNDDV